VYLAEPAPTPYDLHFRLFGVSVRVHPLFWLVSVLLGWNAYARPGGSLGFLAVWVVSVFLSVLLHEFGHVLVGWLFGSKGQIVLYSFGGLAIGSNNLYPRWQRILVLLAGPGIQFLFWGLIALFLSVNPDFEDLRHSPQEAHKYLYWFVNFLWQINLFWPILNLLPVFPLDGGQITREICEAISPQGGVSFSLGLSMVVAGFLGIHSLIATRDTALLPWLPAGDIFFGLMFVSLAVTSYQGLQIESQRRRGWHGDDDLPWER
jgi:Zn-dependent protease